jgi:hypothetical protein
LPSNIGSDFQRFVETEAHAGVVTRPPRASFPSRRVNRRCNVQLNGAAGLSFGNFSKTIE